MRIRPGASPCRGTVVAAGEARPRHYCSREHAAMVLAHRERRQAWEEAREVACLDYATELAEYARDDAPPMLADTMGVTHHA